MSTSGNPAQSKEGNSKRTRTRQKGAICFEVSSGSRLRVRLAQDIDPCFRDSITVSEPDGRSYDDELPSCPLPATGDPYDSCGDEYPLLFCPECFAPEEVERSCRRARCPHSWQSWDFNRAKSIAAKTAAQDAYRNSFETSRKHHVVVSMANLGIRFNSSNPLDRAFQAVKRLMQEVNVSSGYIFYHPYRIVDAYRGEVRGHDSGSGDMTWADICTKLEGNDWSWEAIKDEFLSLEPHFHVLCTSEFVQGGAVTRAIEDKTGVVIDRVTKPHPDPGKSGKVSIYGEKDLCKVTAYCLSHCALEYLDSSDQWRAAYRPFGEVANRTPSDGIAALIDETMRDVSEEVLGVDFRKKSCSNKILDEDVVEAERNDLSIEPPGADSCETELSRSSNSTTVTETSTRSSLPKQYNTTQLPESSRWTKQNTGFSDSRGSTDAAPADTVPEFMLAVPESALKRCGRDLRPIHQAQAFIDDRRAEVPGTQLRNLRHALAVLRIELSDALSEQAMPPSPPPLSDK